MDGRGGGNLASLHWLTCRVEERTCALPLEHVIEVMRPLPVRSVDAAPPFVLGLAVVRGQALPVIDAGRLLTGQASRPTRFVTLRVGERRVVLAVTEVIGTRLVPTEAFLEVPALLAGTSEVRRLLGVVDGRLLEVLDSARLVSEVDLDAGAVV